MLSRAVRSPCTHWGLRCCMHLHAPPCMPLHACLIHVRRHVSNTICVTAGIYPQDGFFDCADELGILLEQDGIFSNGVYETDPAFLELITAETQYQARRLASHPSLFMWSGSNELAPWSHKPGDWWSVRRQRHSVGPRGRTCSRRRIGASLEISLLLFLFFLGGGGLPRALCAVCPQQL